MRVKRRGAEIPIGVSLLVSLTCCATFAGEFPVRYWPTFPKPERIVITETENHSNFPRCLLLRTLAGVVANHTRTEGKGDLIWITEPDAPSYDEWLQRCQHYLQSPVVSDTPSLGSLLTKYCQEGIIKGYILCKADTSTRALHEGTPNNSSANVATALCPILQGVAVEEIMESFVKGLHLPLLADVRDKDETWLWQQYRPQFSRDLLARQDPKTHVVRDGIAAMKGIMVSGSGPLYKEVLNWLNPGSPILGWGIGMEDEQTGPSSEYAILQTATDWCSNLPVLASGDTGLAYPFEGLPTPRFVPQEETMPKRYVSFIMSDGDNVQWLMQNFCKGIEASQYYGCSQRGRIPLGWSIPPADLLQLCPYTLDYLRENAALNDDFVMQSGCYYYPDWFGRLRSETDLLAKHASRLSQYMQKTHVNMLMLNLQDWDGDSARAAYETYCKTMPSLEGIFTVQYYPYTAGKGEILWARNGDREIPVVSCRHAIWAGRGSNKQEGTPSEVASWLKSWASQPIKSEADQFAWVVVHCWSWFKEGDSAAAEEVPQEGQPTSSEISRGYLPACWCAERLGSSVTVVPPSQLLSLMREAHGISGNTTWSLYK
jgi:hypothetical protein